MAQCSAHTRQGKQCRQSAIPGGTVCHYHGGKAPQVQSKARERLAALVDPAIGELGRLIRARKSPSTQLGAIRDVLDRTGFKPIDQTQELPFDEAEIEALEKLSDEEIRAFLEIKRKMKS